MTKDIAAREVAAPLTEFEIEEWRKLLTLLMHDASLATTMRWKKEIRALTTIDYLLAQLKDREEKLATLKELYRVHKDCPLGHYCTLPRDLGCILQGGE